METSFKDDFSASSGSSGGGGAPTALLIGIGVASFVLGAVVSNFVFRRDAGAPSAGLYARAIGEIQAKNYDAAIKDLNKSLEANPSDSASRFALGWAYQLKGWADPAVKQYDLSSSAAAETFVFSNFNRGVVLASRGKSAEAASAYQAVLAVNPKHESALYNLGHIYLAQGQNDLALKSFVGTAEINPRNASALYNAGLSAERLGKKEEAKKHYRAAVAANPALPEAQQRLHALGG